MIFHKSRAPTPSSHMFHTCADPITRILKKNKQRNEKWKYVIEQIWKNYEDEKNAIIF